MQKLVTLFVLALFALMPMVSLAQSTQTVAVGTITPALYKVAGDVTVSYFTLSPTTINSGDVVMSTVRWASISGGTVKVKLPYPGGPVDSTTVNAIAGTVYETRFWHSVSVVGTHTLTVSVSKGTETATATAVLTVLGLTNQPPVIDSFTADTYLVVGQTGSYSAITYDPDGKYLVNTIEWSDGTSNYVSVQNGTINGQVFTDVVSHTFYAPGNYQVRLTTTDVNGASASSTLMVAVVANNPPVWTLVPYNLNVLVGTTVTLDYAATDSDGDLLTFGAYISQGSGGVYIVNRGLNAWRVVFTSSIQIGVTKIQATVSDGRGGQIFNEVTLDVTPANQPPIVKFVRFNGNFSAPGDAGISIDGLDYEGGPGKLYVKYEYSNVSVVDSTSVFFPANLQTTFVPTPRVFNTNVGVVKCTAGFKDAAGAYSLSTWFTFVVSAVTSVEEVEIPIDFSLSQNYPNPFNPTTTIRFGLPNSEYVSLIVYDLLGREVATLVNENKSAGYYEVKFDASNLPSGIYLCRIQAGKFVQTQKMILMK